MNEADEVGEADDSERESPVAPAPPVSVGAFDTFFWTGSVEPPRSPSEMGHLNDWPLIRQVGSGGMGVVFESRDPATGARVAIKLLRPELVNEAQIVHRFLVEARHMRELSHPHILPVTEVIERPGGPCYVSPFLTGGPLSARLLPGRPPEVETVLRIAREIGSALAYAHSRGIIHRDLKPANVLLDGDGKAFLCDFGLVRTVFNDSVSDVSRTHREGTAAYMSPAVAAGQAEDTRCDIYSFGALLYEMLAGSPPYEGRGTEDVVRKVLAGPPEPILKRNPRAPVRLVRVAERCMARELRDRYAQMADVLADLDQFEGRGSLPGSGRDGPKRNHLLAAGGMLLAVGAAIVVLSRNNTARPPVRSLSPSATTLPSQVVMTTQPTFDPAATRDATPVTATPPPPSAIAMRLREMVPTATEVLLDGLPVTDADLAELENATRVTILSLRETRVTDEGLAHLKGLTSLRELRLQHTGVAGAGLRDLADLQKLEHLHLGKCPLRDAELAYLQNLSSLRYLNLSESTITDVGLQHVGQLVQLRELTLGGPVVTDVGLKNVQGLVNLETFGLRGCRVTDSGMHFLRNMRRLVWLDLQATRVHGQGFAELSRLSKLQTLRLDSTPFEHAAVANLQAMLGLRTLSLQNTLLDDAGLRLLAPLQKLDQLTLGGTRVTEGGLQSLASFPQLTVLDLSDLKLPDASLHDLWPLKHLSDLNLNGNPITDAGLRQLEGLSTLRKLSLVHTGVTDEGVAALESVRPEWKVRR